MTHEHIVNDTGNHFTINTLTRKIEPPKDVPSIIQYDHNSERLTFEIDRYIDGHDMTLCTSVEIHYLNSGSEKDEKCPGVYEVTDLQVSTDEEKANFTWLISMNATTYVGALEFAISFSCSEGETNTYSWNTGIGKLTVSKGLNSAKVMTEEYPDILAKWKKELMAAVYGYKNINIGTTRPTEYPYVWFDTTEHMDQLIKHIGVVTVKDANGEPKTLYPVTKLSAIDDFNSDFIKRVENGDIDLSEDPIIAKRYNIIQDNVEECLGMVALGPDFDITERGLLSISRYFQPLHDNSLTVDDGAVGLRVNFSNIFKYGTQTGTLYIRTDNAWPDFVPEPLE